MTMDRRRAMLVGLLVCSSLFTAYTLWPEGSPADMTATGAAPAAPPADQPAPGDALAAAPGGAPAAVSEAPPVTQADLAALRVRLGESRRDPFFTVAEVEAMNRPAEAVATRPDALPAYTVTLVIMTGSQGQALIGRQVVKVGDMLGNERVAQVGPDAVVLEHEGRRRRLEVATSTSTAARIETERTR